MTSQALCDQALRLHQQGQLDEAARLYQQALDGDPQAFLPRHLLGILRLQQGRNDEAVVLIGAALKIHPGHAEALVNYGNALKQCGRDAEALARFDEALAAKPDYAGAPYNRAILLAERGRLEEALEAYGRTLALKPDFAEALHERALLLQTLKRREAALADLDRLLALCPELGEAWNNRGVLLEEMRRFDEALASIDKALALNPESAEALHNRATILTQFRRHDEALAYYDRALELKPVAYARAWTNRGVLLANMKRFAEALESFTRALAINPNDAAALHHRGNIAWLELRDYDRAVADLERAVSLAPDHPNTLGDLVYVKMHGADWRTNARDKALLDEGVRAGKEVVQPFIYQAISVEPADLQACSVIHAQSRYPAGAVPPRPGTRRPGKIHIGYVSGEFREQATAYLTAGLYECHDKAKFEITAFDNGASDNSALRRRLESAFDKFLDISRMSDAAAATRIAGEEIDILVNLNGYFGERRMGIFAARPAPIQVNFLGFPGTLGANYMDYIIADRVVIPETESGYFTEKIVYLPGSYQANDSKRAVAASIPTRGECGLPPGGFVFCNFNNNHKLAPDMFARWMAILKETSGSVLWLLEGHARFAENIRRHAREAGVAGERIIFAPQTGNERHLARLKLADLCLDTLPYNAHTTAADCLWAGVPLITCRGTAFAGRVAASLLGAIGLEELVTEDLDSFQALALRVAGDPGLLESLKQKLAENRRTSPLFDTMRYTRHLETAFQTMMERRENGLSPEGFAVPAGA